MPASAPRLLRVGVPAYLVARPLADGLEGAPGIELVRSVPARLVEDLRAGALDVALVSSIELFRRPGYGYLVGPAVSGAGPVRSVQVFLRRPLAQVTRVVLDPASRAAQVLTRVVLPRRLAQAAEFLELEAGQAPQEAADERGADAWLEIGDAALRRALTAPRPDSFDPCAAWVADTGLPFVFAVWIVRPGVQLAPDALSAFVQARAHGLTQLESLACDASSQWSLPLADCRRYLLEECRYDAGPHLEAALYAFRDAAAALGHCDANTRPRAIPLPACPD